VRRLTSEGWNWARGAQIRGDRRFEEEGKRGDNKGRAKRLGKYWTTRADKISAHKHINHTKKIVKAEERKGKTRNKT